VEMGWSLVFLFISRWRWARYQVVISDSERVELLFNKYGVLFVRDNRHADIISIETIGSFLYQPKPEVNATPKVRGATVWY